MGLLYTKAILTTEVNDDDQESPNKTNDFGTFSRVLTENLPVTSERPKFQATLPDFSQDSWVNQSNTTDLTKISSISPALVDSLLFQHLSDRYISLIQTLDLHDQMASPGEARAERKDLQRGKDLKQAPRRRRRQRAAENTAESTTTDDDDLGRDKLKFFQFTTSQSTSCGVDNKAMGETGKKPSIGKKLKLRQVTVTDTDSELQQMSATKRKKSLRKLNQQKLSRAFSRTTEQPLCDDIEDDYAIEEKPKPLKTTKPRKRATTSYITTIKPPATPENKFKKSAHYMIEVEDVPKNVPKHPPQKLNENYVQKTKRTTNELAPTVVAAPDEIPPKVTKKKPKKIKKDTDTPEAQTNRTNWRTETLTQPVCEKETYNVIRWVKSKKADTASYAINNQTAAPNKDKPRSTLKKLSQSTITKTDSQGPLINVEEVLKRIWDKKRKRQERPRTSTPTTSHNSIPRPRKSVDAISRNLAISRISKEITSKSRVTRSRTRVEATLRGASTPRALLKITEIAETRARAAMEAISKTIDAPPPMPVETTPRGTPIKPTTLIQRISKSIDTQGLEGVGARPQPQVEPPWKFADTKSRPPIEATSASERPPMETSTDIPNTPPKSPIVAISNIVDEGLLKPTRITLEKPDTRPKTKTIDTPSSKHFEPTPKSQLEAVSQFADTKSGPPIEATSGNERPPMETPSENPKIQPKSAMGATSDTIDARLQKPSEATLENADTTSKTRLERTSKTIDIQSLDYSGTKQMPQVEAVPKLAATKLGPPIKTSSESERPPMEAISEIPNTRPLRLAIAAISTIVDARLRKPTEADRETADTRPKARDEAPLKTATLRPQPPTEATSVKQRTSTQTVLQNNRKCMPKTHTPETHVVERPTTKNKPAHTSETNPEIDVTNNMQKLVEKLKLALAASEIPDTFASAPEASSTASVNPNAPMESGVNSEEPLKDNLEETTADNPKSEPSLKENWQTAVENLQSTISEVLKRTVVNPTPSIQLDPKLAVENLGVLLETVVKTIPETPDKTTTKKTQSLTTETEKCSSSTTADLQKAPVQKTPSSDSTYARASKTDLTCICKPSETAEACVKYNKTAQQALSVLNNEVSSALRDSFCSIDAICMSFRRTMDEISQSEKQYALQRSQKGSTLETQSTPVMTDQANDADKPLDSLLHALRLGLVQTQSENQLRLAVLTTNDSRESQVTPPLEIPPLDPEDFEKTLPILPKIVPIIDSHDQPCTVLKQQKRDLFNIPPCLPLSDGSIPLGLERDMNGLLGWKQKELSNAKIPPVPLPQLCAKKFQVGELSPEVKQQLKEIAASLCLDNLPKSRALPNLHTRLVREFMAADSLAEFQRQMKAVNEEKAKETSDVVSMVSVTESQSNEPNEANNAKTKQRKARREPQKQLVEIMAEELFVPERQINRIAATNVKAGGKRKTFLKCKPKTCQFLYREKKKDTQPPQPPKRKTMNANTSNTIRLPVQNQSKTKESKTSEEIQQKYADSLWFSTNRNVKQGKSTPSTNSPSVVKCESHRATVVESTVQATQTISSSNQNDWTSTNVNYKTGLDCFDILDEITLKDLKPLQSEYPRKDHLEAPSRQAVKNSFLYNLMYGSMKDQFLHLLQTEEPKLHCSSADCEKCGTTVKEIGKSKDGDQGTPNTNNKILDLANFSKKPTDSVSTIFENVNKLMTMKEMKMDLTEKQHLHVLNVQKSAGASNATSKRKTSKSNSEQPYDGTKKRDRTAVNKKPTSLVNSSSSMINSNKSTLGRRHSSGGNSISKPRWIRDLKERPPRKKQEQTAAIKCKSIPVVDARQHLTKTPKPKPAHNTEPSNQRRPAKTKKERKSAEAVAEKLRPYIVDPEMRYPTTITVMPVTVLTYENPNFSHRKHTKHPSPDFGPTLSSPATSKPQAPTSSKHEAKHMKNQKNANLIPISDKKLWGNKYPKTPSHNLMSYLEKQNTDNPQQQFGDLWDSSFNEFFSSPPRSPRKARQTPESPKPTPHRQPVKPTSKIPTVKASPKTPKRPSSPLPLQRHELDSQNMLQQLSHKVSLENNLQNVIEMIEGKIVDIISAPEKVHAETFDSVEKEIVKILKTIKPEEAKPLESINETDVECKGDAENERPVQDKGIFHSNTDPKLVDGGQDHSLRNGTEPHFGTPTKGHLLHSETSRTTLTHDTDYLSSTEECFEVTALCAPKLTKSEQQNLSVRQIKKSPQYKTRGESVDESPTKTFKESGDGSPQAKVGKESIRSVHQSPQVKTRSKSKESIHEYPKPRSRGKSREYKGDSPQRKTPLESVPQSTQRKESLDESPQRKTGTKSRESIHVSPTWAESKEPESPQRKIQIESGDGLSQRKSRVESEGKSNQRKESKESTNETAQQKHRQQSVDESPQRKPWKASKESVDELPKRKVQKESKECMTEMAQPKIRKESHKSVDDWTQCTSDLEPEESIHDSPQRKIQTESKELVDDWLQRETEMESRKSIHKSPATPKESKESVLESSQPKTRMEFKKSYNEWVRHKRRIESKESTQREMLIESNQSANEAPGSKNQSNSKILGNDLVQQKLKTSMESDELVDKSSQRKTWMEIKEFVHESTQFQTRNETIDESTNQGESEKSLNGDLINESSKSQPNDTIKIPGAPKCAIDDDQQITIRYIIEFKSDKQGLSDAKDQDNIKQVLPEIDQVSKKSLTQTRSEDNQQAATQNIQIKIDKQELMTDKNPTQESTNNTTSLVKVRSDQFLTPFMHAVKHYRQTEASPSSCSILEFLDTLVSISDDVPPPPKALEWGKIQKISYSTQVQRAFVFHQPHIFFPITIHHPAKMLVIPSKRLSVLYQSELTSENTKSNLIGDNRTPTTKVVLKNSNIEDLVHAFSLNQLMRLGDLKINNLSGLNKASFNEREIIPHLVAPLEQPMNVLCKPRVTQLTNNNCSTSVVCGIEHSTFLNSVYGFLFTAIFFGLGLNYTCQ